MIFKPKNRNSSKTNLLGDPSDKSFKAFLADTSGVAAMEFVLTFPILMAVFLGVVELYGHFQAVRKLSNVTASLADIVAQTRSISGSQLNALRPLAQSLMAPLDSTAISYTITNVRQGNANTDPKLVWQHTHSADGSSNLNNGGNGNCQTYAAPAGKTFPANQDSVYVSVQYTFNSAFSDLVGGSTTYTDNMLSIPRASSTVKLTNIDTCS